MNAPHRLSKVGNEKSLHSDYTVGQLRKLFPDESSARKWFESLRWPKRRFCGHCESKRTLPVKNSKPMPYWCSNCRKYFSVKTGSPMQSSNLPLRTWAFAMHLMTTSLHGVSSMQLHRDLGITQKTAWFLVHRIRAAWNFCGIDQGA